MECLISNSRISELHTVDLWKSTEKAKQPFHSRLLLERLRYAMLDCIDWRKSDCPNAI